MQTISSAVQPQADYQTESRRRAENGHTGGAHAEELRTLAATLEPLEERILVLWARPGATWISATEIAAEVGCRVGLVSESLYYMASRGLIRMFKVGFDELDSHRWNITALGWDLNHFFGYSSGPNPFAGGEPGSCVGRQADDAATVRRLKFPCHVHLIVAAGSAGAVCLGWAAAHFVATLIGHGVAR